MHALPHCPYVPRCCCVSPTAAAMPHAAAPRSAAAGGCTLGRCRGHSCSPAAVARRHASGDAAASASASAGSDTQARGRGRSDTPAPSPRRRCRCSHRREVLLSARTFPLPRWRSGPALAAVTVLQVRAGSGSGGDFASPTNPTGPRQPLGRDAAAREPLSPMSRQPFFD